jgi:ankyrin repeat protein
MYRDIDQEMIEAAGENDVPEVRRLLSVGADVNTTGNDDSGETALHKASGEGHSQVVIELLAHGADIQANDDYGLTPLHDAAINGHLVVVNELLCPSDSNGTTTTIIGKRKSRGADIDPKDRYGHTPLYFAVIRGYLPIVKALLSGGADILAVNNEGELLIHLAMRGRNAAEVTKCLLQHFYATTRRLPLLELLEDLTWVGDPDSMDAPPLRAALAETVLDMDNVVEILEYLVGRNPELLSSLDQDGLLPLHVACRRGAHFPIVQSLVIHNKASVKSVTPQGDFPLFLACEMAESSLDTIFLLMKLYPDLVYR